MAAAARYRWLTDRAYVMSCDAIVLYHIRRKFMMVSHTRALVACPGGFGTCDVLFEIMTLVQTGKHPRIPIVLFGKSYWDQVVNWEKMAEFVSNLAATLQHSRLAAGC